MTTLLPNRISWHGMSVQVPDAWEFARHSVNEHQGSLILVDRRYQRLSLSWTRVERPPDAQSMLAECRLRDVPGAVGRASGALERCGSWIGYTWIGDNDMTLSRYGRLCTNGTRWVELVFSTPAGAQDCRAGVLASFSEAPPDAPSLRWEAFGIALTAPRRLVLQRVECRPGEALMRFTFRREIYLVRRLGVLHTWFNGDTATFLRREAGLAAHQERMAGLHPSFFVAGRERDFDVHWLLGLRRRRSDTAWVCERSKALYLVTATAPVLGCSEDPVVRVACCADGPGGEQ